MHSVTLMPVLIVIAVETAGARILFNFFNVPVCQTLVKEMCTVQYLKQTIKADFTACHVREDCVDSLYEQSRELFYWVWG